MRHKSRTELWTEIRLLASHQRRYQGNWCLKLNLQIATTLEVGMRILPLRPTPPQLQQQKQQQRQTTVVMKMLSKKALKSTALL